MKNIAFLIIMVIAAISCQEKKEEVATTTVTGEFIYLGDAAVLKGDTFIYGVKIDDKMHELAMTVKPLQRDDFDMVPVVVEGVVNKKEPGTEGWDEVLTIVKVLEVKEPKGEAPIRIEGDNSKIQLDSLSQEKNSK